MTDTTVIYGPGTWSVQAFHSDPRTPHLLEWLKANGVDISAMPIQQRISVDATEQGKVIRYVSYVTNPDGTQLREGDSQVYEARTVPLLVDPPDELTARPVPAGPDLAAPVVPLPGTAT